MIGPVRWARSGDSNIAYRVIGEGPVDLIFLGGMISHVEVMLEEPGIRRWFERLGQVARVILVDRRGAGISDPLPGEWTVDDEAQDILAVMNDAELERVVLYAYAAAGPSAIHFVATHPDRALALILYSTVVRSLDSFTKDKEWGPSPAERDRWLASAHESWGDGSAMAVAAPGAARNPRLREWLGRMERLSMTPTGLQRLIRSLRDIDVREELPQIAVPTLVMYRVGDKFIDSKHSHFAAENIPGAKLVELPGADSLPMIGDTETMLSEIKEFITGRRSSGEVTRRLLTIIFTDVVNATDILSRIGDSRWRDLLAAHDEAIRREVERFGGEVIKTAGDSFLISFDTIPSTAAQCASAIADAVAALGIEVRIGLHTGECEIIGDDVGGIAVHIASRIGDLAEAGQILGSATTFGTSVGSGLEWGDYGLHELKGVPVPFQLYVLRSSYDPQVRTGT